jgi:hypothetical protein
MQIGGLESTDLIAAGRVHSLATQQFNATPEGFHDAESGIRAHGSCVAAGWAVDPDDRVTDINVRVLADGIEVATLVANLFRQDLQDAGVAPDGDRGIRRRLDGLVTADVNHEIRVQAQDLQTFEWFDLSSTPRSITCTNLFGHHDGNSGVVDKASCVAAGWAFDADTPAGPRVQVRVRVDGNVVAETTANQFREDVRDAGYGDGFSGWSVRLFGRLTPGRDHIVTTEMRDTSAKRIWVPLADTGLSMTCLP